jgi:hypothetical protein
MSEKELFLYPDVECRNLKDVYLRVKIYKKKKKKKKKIEKNIFLFKNLILF